ncbi:MAG: ABC transporter substrate-binding protein [Desulfobacterales bacterium]|nr:ABC transporter substrate-binding protein [Desulfobacterales bacterium]
MVKRIRGHKVMKTFMLGLCLGVILIISSPAAFAESELRVGWDSSEMLDSCRITNAWHYESQGCMFWQLLYDQTWLLGPSPEYNLVPRAITKFETEDRKKWRFSLREGMKWHDGKPVTAEDIAFGMEYLPGSDPTFSYFDCITVKDSIVIIDDHTIDFELEQKLGHKYAPFNFFPIMPKHKFKRYKYEMTKYDNKQAIGSGPFKLKEFKAGEYIIFEKFAEYWDDRPTVDKISFKPYGGTDAINMALKKGEIDMLGYTGISPLAVKILEKQPHLEIVRSPGVALLWLTFNLHPEDSPIGDLEVRKAIVHAIDKERIIQMVYHGYATPHDSFIYPELPEYNPNLPKYEHDIEKAKKILDEAGYKDTDGDNLRNDSKKGSNIRIKFLTSTDSAESVKIATLIREQLKKVGLDVNIQALDLDTYYDILYYPQGNGFDMAFGGEEPGPYADWIWEFMRSTEGGGAGWNTAYYQNPEFDKLITALYSEDDMDKRNEISFKLQEILLRDLPHYTLARPDILCPVNTDLLQGYETGFMGGVSNWINPWTFFNVHPK